MINTQILITSTNKAINIALKTGDLDMTIINLYRLYEYYIDFTQEAIDNGYDYIEENKQLKEMASFLKYKYPAIICNYKTIVSTIGVPVEKSNSAPTVSDNTIYIKTLKSYQFKKEDFLKDFSDADGDTYSTAIIYPQNLNGGIYYINSSREEVFLTDNYEFDLNKGRLLNLYYTRENNSGFTNDNFNYRVADNNVNKLYSSLQTISMNGEVIGKNQPPTIGDNTIYADNRVTTTLTLAMFTSQLEPPYNDPENDDIDAIRIDTISNANQGTFYLNGIEIAEGQIITREDLENELFTHIAPDTDSISSDVFTFSARDEGSLIWVN